MNNSAPLNNVAEDFVFATGQQYSVRDFVNMAAGEVGIGIAWHGEGVDEYGLVESAPETSSVKPGQKIVAIDTRYFRPAEVETLLGDPTKAKEMLGWQPTTSFADLVKEMMACDLDIAKRDAMVNDAGYKVMHHHE